MNMSHIATVAEWVRRALRAARPSAAFDQVPGIQRLA